MKTFIFQVEYMPTPESQLLLEKHGCMANPSPKIDFPNKYTITCPNKQNAVAFIQELELCDTATAELVLSLIAKHFIEKL